MKTSQFWRDYTSGDAFSLSDVFGELSEMLIELIKFNPRGIKEEFGDSLTYIQLWLYTRLNMDGHLWRLSLRSYKKYHQRKKVWDKIHDIAGIKGVNYCGNYRKKEKIIEHLKELNISQDKINKAVKMALRLDN